MRRDLPAQTSIRGLAALLVFVGHTEFYALFPHSEAAKWAFTPFSWLNEAVDIFFILSGFILHYVYGQLPPQWREYAWARFSRIYPVYLISTLFFLVVAAVRYFSSGTIPDKITIPNVVSNLLLTQWWPWPWTCPSLNYPTWSISVEAFLYVVVFPLLFYFGRHRKIAANLGAVMLIGAVYLLMAALSVFHRQWDWMITASDLRFACLNDFGRGIVCFTTGYLISVLASKWRFALPVPEALEILMLAGFAAAVLFRPPGALWILLLFSPPLIYCASVGSSITTRLLSGSLLVYLGDLSYSLYVWHAPVMSVLSRLFHVRGTDVPTIIPPTNAWIGIGYLLSCLVLVLVVSHLSHFHFELPVKAAIRRWRRGKPRDMAPAHTES